MSRSIHTTRRKLADLKKQNFADDAVKSKVVERASTKLYKKRGVKRQVKSERKQSIAPLAGTDLDSIPVRVLDQTPFVHHGASADDLRAILQALPERITMGISRIQCCLGKPYMDEHVKRDFTERDPYTRRLAAVVFPGLWTGPVYGSFSLRSGLISIYAYVYDPVHLKIPRVVCELYCRFHSLSTFVHEIAHHHDKVQRVRRGRWLADQTPNLEWYAVKMQDQWEREVVMPYLRKRYPQEVAEFTGWLAMKCGTDLPFEFLANDPDRIGSIAERQFLGTADSAFTNWLEKFPSCPESPDARLDFSWGLHFTGNYQSCLKVLGGVLAEKPNFGNALVCKADTLVHLQRLDEADAIAEQLLGQLPIHYRIWRIRAHILELRHEWARLIEHCYDWERELVGSLNQCSEDERKKSKWEQQALDIFRAVAFCALDKLDEMEMTLIAAGARFPKLRQYRIENLRKGTFNRAGKPLSKMAGSNHQSSPRRTHQ